MPAGAYFYGALSSIADQINQQSEQNKHDAQEAAALRKLITIYRPDLKDQTTTADLGALRGVSQAIHLQDAAKQQQAIQEEHAARMADYTAQAQQRTQQSDRAKRIDEQLPVLAQFISNAMDFEGKPFGQAFREGATKFPFGAEGYMLHPAFKALIDEDNARKTQFFQPGGKQVETFPDLPGYARVVLGPNQAQAINVNKTQDTKDIISYRVQQHMMNQGFPAGSVISKDPSGTNVILGPPDPATGESRILKVIGADNALAALLGDIVHPGVKPAPAPATTGAPTPGKVLDETTARAILKEAGGDKAKARALAKQRGYLLQ